LDDPAGNFNICEMRVDMSARLRLTNARHDLLAKFLSTLGG
jgi:hypothetical protein